MNRLLDRIQQPSDLHRLSDEELQQVAQEVREHIIDTVGEIGGHFGANLGACEIAVALHSLLDSPHDKILWDVGHQAYPHKILTGRRDELHPIREDVEEGLTKLPVGIGAAFERLGPHVKESIKAFWAPGLWWEELDFAYIGVIDGHDVRALRGALRDALAAERPVVVHCATVKGKGFAPAEGGLEGMEKWHAAKPHSITNGAPASNPPAAAASRPAAPQYTQV